MNTPSHPPPAESPVDLGADLARLDAQTAALIGTVAGLDDAAVRLPSRCRGWTRGHVITHLARNADSLVNLATWATSGVVTPQYPSAHARAADIEAGAGRAAAELRADLADSAARFRDAAARLAGPLATDVVEIRTGPLPAAQLPRRRIGEVIIHHADLLAGWDLRDADPRSVLECLRLSVERLAAAASPSLTLVTEAGTWAIAGGGQRVEGRAADVLSWLTRGVAEGLGSEVPLPTLPDWG